MRHRISRTIRSPIGVAEPRRRLVIVARILLGAFAIQAMVRRCGLRTAACKLSGVLLRAEQVGKKGRGARFGFDNFVGHVFLLVWHAKRRATRRSCEGHPRQATDGPACELRNPRFGQSKPRQFGAALTPIRHSSRQIGVAHITSACSSFGVQTISLYFCNEGT